jgi:hypothetical protein
LTDEVANLTPRIDGTEADLAPLDAKLGMAGIVRVRPARQTVAKELICTGCAASDLLDTEVPDCLTPQFVLATRGCTATIPAVICGVIAALVKSKVESCRRVCGQTLGFRGQCVKVSSLAVFWGLSSAHEGVTAFERFVRQSLPSYRARKGVSAVFEISTVHRDLIGG